MVNTMHGLVLAVAMMPAAAAEIDVERQAELRHMLKHDCGACHGLRLSGGLGPPLTPAALSGKSPPVLAAIIRQGVPGTPMPPWKAMLSDDEARWLADLLKSADGGGSGRP